MERVKPLKRDFSYISQEKGAHYAMQGHMGNHEVWARSRKEK